MNLEATNLLKDSFFAKRVIMTIKEDGPYDESKEELFIRIQNFIKKVREGKDQMDSGKLAEEPVKSIIAYRKAIDTVFLMPYDVKKDEKCFKEILDKISKEVEYTIKLKEISINNLKTTLDYFTQFRKLATRQASRQLINEQELVSWPAPMQF